MKVSFNGMRLNLARAYNSVVVAVQDGTAEEKIDAIHWLQSCVGGLLACYEEGNEDCQDLSAMVKLLNIGPVLETEATQP